MYWALSDSTYLQCSEHYNLFMLIKYYLLLFCLLEMPKFAEPIANVTVPVGREATLVCVVDDLGSYKVSNIYIIIYYIIITVYQI